MREAFGRTRQLWMRIPCGPPGGLAPFTGERCAACHHVRTFCALYCRCGSEAVARDPPTGTILGISDDQWGGRRALPHTSPAVPLSTLTTPSSEQRTEVLSDSAAHRGAGHAHPRFSPLGPYDPRRRASQREVLGLPR